ncbi:uncharacterized protein LOC109602165 [Aethina tumida]|uniref:uncharacterized protein LOC109602165 n=1 Tax=Aethina tumida TaxID=116153 RepID=UPI00096AFA02|nr:uncharacterized protein LOC109602165 [Aethina tumida]
MRCVASLLVLCVLLLCVQINSGFRVVKRTAGKMLESCHQDQACGWASYHKTSRQILFYMKNTCECPPNLRCYKDFDDVSISSWTYKCKVPEISKSRQKENH